MKDWIDQQRSEWVIDEKHFPSGCLIKAASEYRVCSN